MISDVKHLTIDGLGYVGKSVIKCLTELSPLPPTQMRVTDLDKWQTKHARAGLVEPSEVGLPKATSAARRLCDAGIAAEAFMGDCRNHPRSFYFGGITIAATDSHQVKSDSILKSQQAGSPAIAIGLGPAEATVEFYSPGSAGYCCCHGQDPGFFRRVGCELLRKRVSTTALVCDNRPVEMAAELAAEIAVEYLRTSEFPGGRGAYIRQAMEWYDFAIDSNCEGPHDPPFEPAGPNVVTVPASSDDLPVRDVLQLAGSEHCYADRDVSGTWNCNHCRRTEHARVHTVHPPAECAACGRAMQPGVEQVSGLTADELAEHNGGHNPKLAELGLRNESIIRLVQAATGDVTWVHLLEEEG